MPKRSANGEVRVDARPGVVSAVSSEDTDDERTSDSSHDSQNDSTSLASMPKRSASAELVDARPNEESAVSSEDTDDERISDSSDESQNDAQCRSKKRKVDQALNVLSKMPFSARVQIRGRSRSGDWEAGKPIVQRRRSSIFIHSSEVANALAESAVDDMLDFPSLASSTQTTPKKDPAPVPVVGTSS